MKKILKNRIFVLILFIIVTGCTVSSNNYSSKRSLMLLDSTEQPVNAKFTSQKYQKGLRKRVKKNSKNNKKRYKKAKK